MISKHLEIFNQNRNTWQFSIRQLDSWEKVGSVNSVKLYRSVDCDGDIVVVHLLQQGSYTWDMKHICNIFAQHVLLSGTLDLLYFHCWIYILAWSSLVHYFKVIPAAAMKPALREMHSQICLTCHLNLNHILIISIYYNSCSSPFVTKILKLVARSCSKLDLEPVRLTVLSEWVIRPKRPKGAKDEVQLEVGAWGPLDFLCKHNLDMVWIWIYACDCVIVEICTMM